MPYGLGDLRKNAGSDRVAAAEPVALGKVREGSWPRKCPPCPSPLSRALCRPSMPPRSFPSVPHQSRAARGASLPQGLYRQESISL